MNSPLATVAFPCFNQATYVREALRSLLEQDYTPLEIVISDDASTDDTFAIVQEEVARYDGPHQVVVHRNQTRQGIENYNQLMSMAQGQLVVMAHSDDVACRDRVAKLVAAWQAHGVSMVSSNAIVIEEDGSERGLYADPEALSPPNLQWYVTKGFHPATLGACLAWDQEVFEKFGPLDSRRSAISTDTILPYRACLLKGIHYVSEPLVRRRVHPEGRARKFLLNAAGDRQTNREATLANRITQMVYMFETARTMLPEEDERRKHLLSQLASRILQASIRWTTARNELLSQRKQNTWLLVD